jgi:hypothetical protein
MLREMVSLNIEAIHQSTREQWFKQRARRRSFRQLIEASVPSWIVILACALFALSAPHTTKMFNMITPGWGGAGVLLCEFGLLYIAFRRKTERKVSGKLPRAIWGLEALLFLTAIIVNGSGALIAVVASAGIDTLSADTIIKGLGTMPIVAQVGLVLVPLAALIIPIGTVVAGEGLAAHVLEGKQAKTELDNEWAEVEQLEVYRAAYSYLLKHNVNPRDAQRRAGSATQNLFNRPLPPDTLNVELESSTQSASVMPSVTQSRTILRTPKRAASPVRRQDARMAVRLYLEQNPLDANLSVRQLAQKVGVSKTIAGEEQAAFKAKSGGVNE